MSAQTGIPTYTSAPVNPNQEEETTASKAEPASAPTTEPTSTGTDNLNPPASATATAPAYPPIYATTQDPQPAAAASLPAPTGAPSSAQNAPATSTQSIPSTSTSPPAPQPGAIPTPPVAGYTPTAPSPVPPPPKAGDVPQAPAPTQTAAAGPAPAAFTQSYAYHRPTAGAIPNSTSTPYTSVYPETSTPSRQGLPLHNSGGGGGAGDIFPEEEGFMSSARGWMQSAGAKLAEVEAEVWKRINDVHEK